MAKRRLLMEKNGFPSEYKVLYLEATYDKKKKGEIATMTIKLQYKIIPAELKDKFTKIFNVKLMRYNDPNINSALTSILKNNEQFFNLVAVQSGNMMERYLMIGTNIDEFLSENK